MKRSSSALFLLFFLSLISARAETVSTDNSTDSVVLGSYLAAPPSPEETERITSVLHRFSKGGDADIRVSGERTRFISPREVYLLALKKNLSIAISRQSAAVAREAVQEAEAVFDPVLSLSFTYSETDTNDRSKEVMLQTKKFWPPAETSIPTNPFNPEAQIVAIGWKQQYEGVQEEHNLYASQEEDTGPVDTFDYNLSVSQKLPWGPQVKLGLSMQDEDVYYDGQGHSYGKPWAATFVADLATPLPFTKDFGPDSPNDAAIRLSEKRSEIAGYEVEAAINSLLYQADLAYWNVVRRFENLTVLIERRKLLDKRLADAERSFAQREATNYDLLQVRSSLALGKAREVEAAGLLFDASYALAALIEDEAWAQAGVLYLPYGYLGLLDSLESPDVDNALKRAMEHRPEILAAGGEVGAAEINRDAADNQRLPNLKAYAGYKGAQDGSTYGYGSPLDSLDSMGNVDQEDWYASLSFNYPILNRALDARFEQARLGVGLAELGRRTTENSVVREVGDAVARVRTSKSRITAARESEKLAALAYDKVLARQGYGEAGEFEVLLALQRLSEARLSLVLARIAHRTALAELKAATGELASSCATSTATDALDRRRMEALNNHNALRFFARGDEPGEKQP